MTITMINPIALTLADIKEFVKAPGLIKFKSKSKVERNEWIENILRTHKYFQLSKSDKGAIRSYIQIMTGLPKSQLTRLIKEYKTRAIIKPKDLSVSHLYRLRTTRRYHEKVKKFKKTRPTKVPIGERRKPEPSRQTRLYLR